MREVLDSLEHSRPILAKRLRETLERWRGMINDKIPPYKKMGNGYEQLCLGDVCSKQLKQEIEEALK